METCGELGIVHILSLNLFVFTFYKNHEVTVLWGLVESCICLWRDLQSMSNMPKMNCCYISLIRGILAHLKLE